MMKLLIVCLLLVVSGCTSIDFDPETNAFSFYSTKEYKSFEAKFKDGDKEVYIKAVGVEAFEGRQIVADQVGKVAGAALVIGGLP